MSDFDSMDQFSPDKLPAPPRAKVEWRVGMKTFGTRHFFDMVTTNVSATGLLLKVDNPKDVAPFQRKTLLELVFYPDGNFLKHEIRAMGVVVRYIDSLGEDPRKEQFGVRIVEAPEGFESLITKVLAETNQAA